MNIKRFIIFLLIFSLMPMCVYAETDNVSLINNEANLDIQSPVALLMESETGTVLYEKNAYEKKYPASTTKMITAILTLENCDLNDTAIVSKEALLSVPSDYTNANLQVGEELTIRDLLYAFLIPSANDCGFVLAEHIAGSIENFAEMMNLKATEIGCKNTHFTNPSGIQDENHYSTAYDLALIGRYAMQNDVFREIVSTSSYNLPATNKYDSTDRRFVNTNFLIRESQKNYYYEYATGIKTGFTDDAGDCIVASAKKDGVEYIAVVLQSGYDTTTWLKEKFIDCVTLFDYAFENYTTKSLNMQGEVFDKVKVSGATKDTKYLDIVYEDNIDAFISNEQLDNNFSSNIVVNDKLKAPISKGDVVGSVSYTINDITYSSNLIAGNDVIKSNLIPNILKTVLAIFILFLILMIVRYINYRRYVKRKKNYRKNNKKIKYI